MPPSAAQNAQRLAQSLSDAGFDVKPLRTRYRITDPKGGEPAYVPFAIEGHSLDAHVARLREEIGYDPDGATAQMEADRAARQRLTVKIPATPPLFSSNEATAVEAPPPASKSTTPAAAGNRKPGLFDKLYAQAVQMPGKKYRVTWAELSGPDALELLGLNDWWTPPEKGSCTDTFVRSNRKVRPSVVKSYSRDYLAGIWRDTDQAVAFDDRKKLLNSQHRMLGLQLAAQTDPNIRIGFPIWFDLPPESYDGYDQGANRNFGDVAGDKPNAFLLGSTVTLVMQYLEGQDWRANISPVARKTFVDEHPLIHEAVKLGQNTASSKSVKIKAAVLAALAYLVMSEMPDRKLGMVTDPLELFLAGVRSGANMSSSDPRLGWREWGLRFEKDVPRRRKYMQLAVGIKCFNKFLLGKPMSMPDYNPGRELEYPTLLPKGWTAEQRQAFAKRHKIAAE